MVHASYFFINFMKLMIEQELFRDCPQNSAGKCYSTPLAKNESDDQHFCYHGDVFCDYENKKKYTTEYLYW